MVLKGGKESIDRPSSRAFPRAQREHCARCRSTHKPQHTRTSSSGSSSFSPPAAPDPFPPPPSPSSSVRLRFFFFFFLLYGRVCVDGYILAGVWVGVHPHASMDAPHIHITSRAEAQQHQVAARTGRSPCPRFSAGPPRPGGTRRPCLPVCGVDGGVVWL